jgi:hypothetical protein
MIALLWCVVFPSNPYVGETNGNGWRALEHMRQLVESILAMSVELSEDGNTESIFGSLSARVHRLSQFPTKFGHLQIL